MSVDRYWILLGRKLSGEITEEELKELASLTPPDQTESAPRQLLENGWPHHAAGSSAEDQARMLARLRDKLKDEESFQPLEPEAPATGKWRRRLLWTGGMAACLAGLIAALLYYNGRQTAAVMHEITAKPGIKSRISLPDGSTVWLNSGSRLVYDEQFGRRNRNLQLSGEAFFDVAPQDGVPFVIQAQGVEVRVLGTSFNLKAYDNEPVIETSLVTGKVQVRYAVGEKKEMVLLKPMEKLQISRPPVTADRPQVKEEIHLETLEYLRGADSLIAETAWKENTLSCDRESFGSLAARLERWYNVRIEFATGALRNLEFTATVKSEKMEEVFDALMAASGNGFRYSFNKEERIITIHETR